MARSSTGQIVKKNTKLETFLKRNLDVDTYEKIRAHDSCIVCSEKEDKAFKYIVLTDEWIYLTENPPKKIYETVHLKDLLSVELVNDYPAFLQGEEQQNTQHIVVKYLTDGNVKGKKRRSSRSKEKNDTLDSSASLAVPSSARSYPVNPIIRPYSSRSLSARETKEMKLITAQQLLAELHRSQTDSNLLRQNMDSSNSKRVQFTKNSSPILTQKNGKSEHDDLSLAKKQTSTSVSNNNQCARGKSGRRKKKKDLESSSSNGISSKLTPRIKGELKLDLSKLEMSADEEETDEESSRTSIDLNKNTKSTKRADLPDTVSAQSDQVEAVREMTMHLYIMNARSKILMLIQSAQHNYLMRGTLEKDPQYIIKTTVITPRSAQSSSEKLEFLFRQLKTELQYCTNTMIDNFFHIHELKVAAERNFALRKLFWKTPDVFRFMVNELTNYMSIYGARLKNCQSEEQLKLARADELEYMVLILETLSIVCRETEIVPTRVEIMKYEAGRITQQLIASLITCPEVPMISDNISHTLQNSSDSTLSEQETDRELYNLLNEYRNMSTAVLFELFIIGEQATWCDSETTLLNVSWIAKQLGDKKQLEPFLEHVIKEAMGMLSSRRLDPVTPSLAVLLYQQFHILKTLTFFSTDITDFIRDKFFEEFKYYIQAPVLDVKLPMSYPLRPNILKLMEDVVKEVLQKSVKLSSS